MPSNIRVFLDVTIGTKTGGRIVFELFNDVAPMAVENFRGLCTGEYGNSKTTGFPLSFKGCKFFRVVPGFIAQSGDFECNNGDGGESVYGGTFKDESFLRRHAQAGVLSMANKGHHTNGSQFFVTLKRAPLLDGKHVAFGQLVQGMEILRAIEKCPIDSNNTPRVPIQIVDCGELQKLPVVRRNDPKVQMRESIAILMSSLEVEISPSTQQRVTDTQLGAKKIQQALEEAQRKDGMPQPIAVQNSMESLKRNKAISDESESEKKDYQQAKRRRTSEKQEEVEEVLDLQDERQKKLYELRLRLNQSRKLNAKEVSQETQEQRQSDPNIRFLINKRKLKECLVDFDRTTLICATGKIEEEEESDGDEKKRIKRKDEKQKYYSDRQYLNESADAIQWKDDRRKRKESNIEKSFGWNAMNVESHYRAHKKRTHDLKINNEAYASQMLQLGERFYDPTSALVSAEFKPTEEAKERVAQEIEKQSQKRKTFSRRRLYIEDENVGYINEYNRSFNKKLERAYGAQSMEIRQNLERGTAL